MKKFFSLLVMMCLLGVGQARADFIYFGGNHNDDVDDHDNPLHSFVVTRNAGDNENTAYTINVQLKWWGDTWGIGNINGDYTWYLNNYGDDVHSEIINNSNGTKSIKVWGKGGAVVVDANGLHDGEYHQTFFVITLPPLDNYVWDFFGESAESEGHILRHPQNNVNWFDTEKNKNKPTDASLIVKAAQVAGGHTRGSHTKIDGTNAFYLPSTAGMVFDAAEGEFGYYHDNRLETMVKQQYVEREFVSFGGCRTNNKPSYTLPQVKAGKYIKVWCNPQAQGNGGQFNVTNLRDLEGKKIDDSFTFAGVTYYGECLGCLIFKVDDATSVRKDVTFTLLDNLYWNDIYKIEITDEYSTDLELDDITHNLTDPNAWSERNYVQYNNQYAHIVHDGNGTDLQYSGTAGPIFIQRGCTCNFEVYPEGDVTIESTVQTEGTYHNLQLFGVKGTGNIKIIVKEVFGGDNAYVLDKKEAWIAVGTYTQQTYPYTWDFTDYNVSQGSLYAWLSGSNTYGTQKYGHWKMEDSETYALETHEQVNGTILNGQTNQYEKVDKPLFAQGAQLTYWKQDNTIGIIKEAEGLRVKQAWGTKGELAVGEEFDGELSINGKCLKYTPAGEWSRLHITIPNVDAGMYVFIKADDGTEEENYANPSVKIGNAELTVDNSYNTKNKVRAYKVTTTGDVDITFANAAQIKAIGVTNIFKSINALGYATESRDVDIDHVYEGEFTKNDVNAHCILTYNDEGFTYNYKGTPDVRKSQVMNVIPKNTGIVLYKEGHSGDAFNVPLFYPACNAKVKDAEQIALDNNWMAPNVESTLHSDEEELRNGETCTKFIMTRTYYTYNKPDGSSTGPQTTNVGAFYRLRIDKDASHTEAERTKNNTIGANKAYLLIPSTKLPTALWNGDNGQGVPQQAKGVIFIDLADVVGVFDETTDINDIYVKDVEEIEQDVYYTLSGTRLERKPTAKGVYICNGKKVFVK